MTSTNNNKIILVKIKHKYRYERKKKCISNRKHKSQNKVKHQVHTTNATFISLKFNHDHIVKCITITCKRIRDMLNKRQLNQKEKR